jgi:hypothetical protein
MCSECDRNESTARPCLRAGMSATSTSDPKVREVGSAESQRVLQAKLTAAGTTRDRSSA